MWWIIAIVIIVLGGFAGLSVARKRAAERRRSADWDDLHQRGKLIATQLAHFREVAARKDPA